MVTHTDGDAFGESARAGVLRRVLEMAPLAGLDASCQVAARSLHATAAIAVIVDGADVHVVGYGPGKGPQVGIPWDDAADRAQIASVICPSIAADNSAVAVEDTSASPELALAGVAAYAAAPVRDARGNVLGTFCALEQQPRQWTGDDVALAEEYAALLGSRLQLAVTLRDNALAAEVAEREHGFLVALLEGLEVGLVAVDKTGRIVVMNRTLREFYGAPEGTSLQDWFQQQDDIRVFGPDGRTLLGPATTPLGRAMAGEPVSGAEMVIQQSGRPPRRVVANVQPIVLPDGSTSGAVGTSYDITARVRTEALARLLADAALITSADPAEGAAEAKVIDRVLAQVATDLEWPDTVHLWPGDDIDAESEPRAVSRARSERSTVADSEPGERTTLAVPVTSGTATLGVIEISGPSRENPDLELTSMLEAVAGHVARHLERRRAEQLAAELAAEREELLRQQQQNNRELVELDRMKSEFTAAIGHELRTPLTVIQGYAALLAATGGLEGRAMEWAMAIQRRCEDVQRLLGDFLDLTKLEAGMALEQRPQVDLDDLVAEVIRDHAESARHAHLTVGQSLEARATVSADPRRLRQVIDNLVSNAIKYSEPDGEVLVSTVALDGVVVLTVRDEGIGVLKAELPRIFERFFRAQGARDRDIDGTGLGLAVTREIVQAHGGTITGERNDSRGMRFTVTLPVEDGQADGCDPSPVSSDASMS